jgi:thioredoxin-dependent peroxiredoxin
VLVGVSRDSVESHRRFAEKHGLRCHLLADPDGAIVKRLGVAGPLGMARRTTFVIDRSGIVRHVYENAPAKGHAADVLRAVEAL